MRTEFKKKIKLTVINRSTVNNIVRCEHCGGVAKKYQIDHIIPDSIGGEATLENAQLLCEVCYGEKNPKDTTRAAKTKRQTEMAVLPRESKLQSRGFTKKVRKHAGRPIANGMTYLQRIASGDDDE
jgi:5-methylcytosine-specific restriction endonuclease McrA